MVSPTMRRYRHRTAEQEAIIDADSIGADGFLDPIAMFGRGSAENPIPLRCELGFGHGNFLSGMAAAHPEENFIGVEHDRLRVTKTAAKSLKLDAHNVRLFCADAQQFVRERFAPESLDRCYILFSDPWPKRRHRRRRVINRAFLLDVAYALKSGGKLEIATDCHEYAMMALSHTSTLPGVFRNCYNPAGYRFNIPTRFPTVFEKHKKAEGETIAYLKLERSSQPLPKRAPLALLGGNNDGTV